jgi:hypothetical protein
MVVDDMARTRANRDEWRKRVERWKDSGLTAGQFAAENGLNAGTLQFWQYKLKRDARTPNRGRRRGTAESVVSSLVEVRPSVRPSVDARFEIELGNGRRLRVPSEFDPAVLGKLLTILEAATCSRLAYAFSSVSSQ